MARCHGYAFGCRCTACLGREKEFPALVATTPAVKEEMRTLLSSGYVFDGLNDDDEYCFVHRKLGDARVLNPTVGEAAIMDYSESLEIPCDLATARRVLGRFPLLRDATKALDGMKRAAERQAA